MMSDRPDSAAVPVGFPAHALDALGLGRPELRAWAMYDWANSAMTTTIITAVFPFYFADVAAAGMPEAKATQYDRGGEHRGDGHHRGPRADPRRGGRRQADQEDDARRVHGAGRRGGRRDVLHPPGRLGFGRVLFVVANIGVNGSFVFYDSLLPHVARAEEVDRVSTAGYALGYVGGGILLTLNLAWIMKPGLVRPALAVPA